MRTMSIMQHKEYLYSGKSHNLFTDKQICIIGTGGFAREVYCCLVDIFHSDEVSIKDKVVFLDKDELCMQDTVMGCKLIKESTFDANKYVAFIAVGEPHIREKIYNKYPKETEYATIIHPSAVVSDWAEIGEGSIITACCVVTCNIKIGKQAHINLNSTIGHDCVIGDFFTTAPDANISGICNFGNRVYFGTNSCVKQGISICDDVTIGMGGVVVKDIQERGVYIGNPLRKLK